MQFDVLDETESQISYGWGVLFLPHPQWVAKNVADDIIWVAKLNFWDGLFGLV